MKSKKAKYEKERERMKWIISNPKSSKEDVEYALKVLGRLSQFLKEINKLK